MAQAPGGATRLILSSAFWGGLVRKANADAMVRLLQRRDASYGNICSFGDGTIALKTQNHRTLITGKDDEDRAGTMRIGRGVI